MCFRIKFSPFLKRKETRQIITYCDRIVRLTQKLYERVVKLVQIRPQKKHLLHRSSRQCVFGRGTAAVAIRTGSLIKSDRRYC